MSAVETPLRLLRRLAAWRSRPQVVRHQVTLAGWRGKAMTIAVLADLHVVAPWTQLRDLRRIVRQVNGLEPDMVVLAGDFLAGQTIPGRRATAKDIVSALDGLRARLGVFAILGNHDWFDCPLARERDFEHCSVIDALEGSGFRLLRNEAVALDHGDRFWLVGFDSQRPTPADWRKPLHDPERAFAAVPEGAPAILLAHEPDYFAQADGRAGLQISGHTHGGQLNLFGWRPVVPSRYRGRYAWGHLRESGRSLVVSGGIGFSGVPLRIGIAPEITVVRVRRADAT